jgi:hypothetical protein
MLHTGQMQLYMDHVVNVHKMMGVMLFLSEEEAKALNVSDQ